MISDIINNEPFLEKLVSEVNNLSCTWNDIRDAKTSIYNVIRNKYAQFLHFQPSEYQHNDEFKQSIFTSLEDVIMSVLHEKLFSFVCDKNQVEDKLIYKKCCELSALKVTPDQLGALEDYAIPLPATVVELAAMDIHKTPSEKLTCVSTAFDLALAELKGAMVDVIALTCDNKIPMISVSDLTPILATIVIHAKPAHFVSNLCYIENFLWSTSPVYSERECLLAFKTAVDKLTTITVDKLLPKSTRIYSNIALEDIFKLTSDEDSKYNRKGQRICAPDNPLERHLENTTKMIAASTLTNTQI